MSIISTSFDRYYSPWGGITRKTMKRIDAILLRDEQSGFKRLSDSCRSHWTSLYNALDLSEEADRAGCPPYHRHRLLSTVRRILGRE